MLALRTAAAAAVLGASCAAGLSIDSARWIFAFGDSYTATGYDAAKGLRPQDQPTSTKSGALNWLNYLAAEHSLTNTTFDFARCSAVTDTSIVDSWAGDLGNQVDSFVEHFVPAPEEVAWRAGESLFVIFVGINDIGHAEEHGQEYAGLIAGLFESYDRQVERLYDAGARNFVMLNLPPMDRSPHVAAFPRPARHKFAAHLALANAYLDAFADSLPSRYAGASAFLFDTHSTVGAVLDDPAAFGFRDSTGWCGAYENLVMDPGAYDEDECKWPLSEYVYYDSYHLSWAAQAELGKAVGNALSTKAETERFRQRRHQKSARRFGQHKVAWEM